MGTPLTLRILKIFKGIIPLNTDNTLEICFKLPSPLKEGSVNNRPSNRELKLEIRKVNPKFLSVIHLTLLHRVTGHSY